MYSITLLPRKNKIGIAAASVTGKSVVFSDVAWHTLPENFVGDGMLSNAEQFAEYVEQALGEKAHEAHITVCLDSSEIPAFVFSHADVGAGAVRKMRELELKTLFGGNTDSVYTCDRKLANGKAFNDGKCRHLIYSVEKTKVDALCSVFDAKNLKLDRIVPFTALFEESAGALWALPIENSGIKTAVYAGDYDASVAVFSDGVPVAVRSIDVDAMELIESVMHYFKVSEEDARAKIMNGGLEEFSGGMAEDVWLYEKVISYYREFASSVARAVNAVIGGTETKVSGVFIAGSFTNMKGFATMLGEALSAEVTTIKEFVGTTVPTYATSINAAVSAFPLYASFSDKDRVNILDEKKGSVKVAGQMKAFGIVISVILVLLMSIMPLRYYIVNTDVNLLSKKLELSEYVSALELESRLAAASDAEKNAITVLKDMPTGQSYAYKCVSELMRITSDYGLIGSIEYNDDMTVTMNVSCGSYQLATGWKNAINASKYFSFISIPPINRSGMSYELEAMVVFNSELAAEITDAVGETSEGATEKPVPEEVTSEEPTPEETTAEE